MFSPRYSIVVLVSSWPMRSDMVSMATVWSKKPWSGREKVHAFAMFSGLVGFIYWAHFWCLV
ncbi:hypothetical protein AOA80_01860 [Methanomassiliicoccales archaeon RumEn M1]|nr:hypothetical protein AOA80_01860 [Methanomassiliicoccales archaeon RumEn M1]